VATKKVGQQIFPLSFFADVGSGIRDPGSRNNKIQEPGSGTNTSDPQH